TDTVRRCRTSAGVLETDELTPVAHPRAVDVPDFRLAGSRVGDVEQRVIRREAQPVRLHDLVGDDLDPSGVAVDAVYGGIELRLGPEAFVVAANAVDRIREPDAAVRMDDDVVRRVEPSAVEAVGQHGHR